MGCLSLSWDHRRELGRAWPFCPCPQGGSLGDGAQLALLWTGTGSPRRDLGVLWAGT